MEALNRTNDTFADLVGSLGDALSQLDAALAQCAPRAQEPACAYAPLTQDALDELNRTPDWVRTLRRAGVDVRC